MSNSFRQVLRAATLKSRLWNKSLLLKALIMKIAIVNSEHLDCRGERDTVKCDQYVHIKFCLAI